MICISTSMENPDSSNNHWPPTAEKANHVLGAEHRLNELPLERALLISVRAAKRNDCSIKVLKIEFIHNYKSILTDARPASSRAMGTLNGEQDT